MRLLVPLALILLLNGCSAPFQAIGKSAQVIWDPSLPVGHPENRPSRVDLSMVAERDVNPNYRGIGTPLMFQILQLKDDSMLMAADFPELKRDLEETLGTNYLVHDDFTLLPGQFKFYAPFEIDEDTRYMGVIALYADPNRAQWKKVVRVDATGNDYHLLVHLREHEVELRKEN
ncbi:type VI secretion system protein VasD [Modicisalibacter ilicicola DSM 19980]|uniref:Type VI secretion system protein VasD n=1 Tax=Modicisalibacter ilicicola DSM 19980 TaxID=1121942 RepID=A0A1M5B333_9GAMM|nr:type VI secretion system lipoprotein TssJ [Halomonas ilicicola]SHF36879.1 type VI secretion system protein VasD [Halomonas ilicicola DSM 19980]